MATFSTGDPNLNQSFGVLAQAMFPDPLTKMNALYRKAAATEAFANAEQARVEADLLQEQARLQQAAAPAMSDFLTAQAYPDAPGLSEAIAGPIAPEVHQTRELYDVVTPALLAREGNIDQFSSALGRMTGMSGMLDTGADEDKLRRFGTLYTGDIPAASDAFTTAQIEANQAADRAEAESVARIRSANAPRQPFNYRTPDGTTGMTRDGLTDIQTGAPLPPNTIKFQGTMSGTELQNATTREGEGRLINIGTAVASANRLLDLVQSNPSVVGITGDVIRVGTGLLGQVGDLFEGQYGERLASREEWRQRIQQELGSGDGSAQAVFRSQLLDLAVQLARSAESGGRLSDQDIQRQLEILGAGPTASSAQVIAAINSRLDSIYREDETLRTVHPTAAGIIPPLPPRRGGAPGVAPGTGATGAGGATIITPEDALRELGLN